MHQDGFGASRLPPRTRGLLRPSRLLVLAAVLQVTPGHGQDVIWIGRPTTRDYMALNLQRGLKAYGELRMQLAQFEKQIDEARQAYFNAPPGNRAAAADQFGYLLFQKDLLIAMPRIIGNKDQAEFMGAVMSLGNLGRPVDGGIPPMARRAFNEWVSAVRLSAGAGYGSASAPDPAHAAAAMDNSASLKEYEAYRRLRDQAENNDWEARRTRTPLKLAGPGITVRPSAYFGENVTKKGFDHQVRQLGEKIIQCTYAGRQAKGSVYDFWQGQAPGNIAFLMAMNPGALDGVKDHAVDQCPPDSKQALDLAMSPSKVAITREMSKDAQAQSRSAPADPERVRAVQERNAAARQRMADDRTAQDAKQAQYRVCSDNLRAGVTAARQAHDIQASSAAHAQFAQCQADLRAQNARRP